MNLSKTQMLRDVVAECTVRWYSETQQVGLCMVAGVECMWQHVAAARGTGERPF